MSESSYYNIGRHAGWLFAAFLHLVVGLILVSLVTSGIKKMSKECGKTYKIEEFSVKGDLFCG